MKEPHAIDSRNIHCGCFQPISVLAAAIANPARRPWELQASCMGVKLREQSLKACRESSAEGERSRQRAGSRPGPGTHEGTDSGGIIRECQIDERATVLRHPRSIKLTIVSASAGL